MNAVAPVSQNWEAFLQLELRAGEDKTHMVPIRRYGPLSVQRPFYPESQRCHVYLLHPPGGIVGGDQLELQLDVKPNAKALMTTPGANKFYRSAADIARVSQNFEVAAGGQLEFLPQENIYFPGAQVRNETSIRVQSGGRVMLWEKHCFGRPANHELFDNGEVVSAIELRDAGKLVYTEKQRIDATEINRSSGLRGHPVMGSMLIYGVEIDRQILQSLRQVSCMDGISGVTQLQPELTIVRYLGNSTRRINAYFIRLWELLRPAVMQQSPCHPRIWKT